MALMPGAEYRPLSLHGGAMRAFDIVCLHTMVGSLLGTDNYFKTGAANSHFGTGGDGRIFQWLDTSIQSWANLNGNHHIISVENADLGPEFGAWNTSNGGAVPAFTDAQIEANARICAWANQVHGIPLELIPDSKPGRRGIGYHRQGVPGYMVTGGEQWSNARGKVCPGDRRIAQIPQIIARARELVGGAAPAPAPAPVPAPAGKRPLLPAWNLKPGQYLGHKNGPAASVGGFYGPLFIIEAVQCAMVFLGCVPGVPAGAWETSTWSDGVWEDATTDACRRLYARFDFGNETFTDRIYREDYEVLRNLVAAA